MSQKSLAQLMFGVIRDDDTGVILKWRRYHSGSWKCSLQAPQAPLSHQFFQLSLGPDHCSFSRPLFELWSFLPRSCTWQNTFVSSGPLRSAMHSLTVFTLSLLRSLSFLLLIGHFFLALVQTMPTSLLPPEDISHVLPSPLWSITMFLTLRQVINLLSLTFCSEDSCNFGAGTFAISCST